MYKWYEMLGLEPEKGTPSINWRNSPLKEKGPLQLEKRSPEGKEALFNCRSGP